MLHYRNLFGNSKIWWIFDLFYLGYHTRTFYQIHYNSWYGLNYINNVHKAVGRNSRNIDGCSRFLHGHSSTLLFYSSPFDSARSEIKIRRMVKSHRGPAPKLEPALRWAEWNATTPSNPDQAVCLFSSGCRVLVFCAFLLGTSWWYIERQLCWDLQL